MDKFLESLISFAIIFTLFYIGNYYLNLKRKYNKIVNKKTSKKKSKKGKKNKPVTIMELSYLITKFKLDINKMDLLYCIRWISFLDAFIIALTCVIIFLLPWDLAWQLVTGFVIVFGLIYALYEMEATCVEFIFRIYINAI